MAPDAHSVKGFVKRYQDTAVRKEMLRRGSWITTACAMSVLCHFRD